MTSPARRSLVLWCCAVAVGTYAVSEGLRLRLNLTVASAPPVRHPPAYRRILALAREPGPQRNWILLVSPLEAVRLCSSLHPTSPDTRMVAVHYPDLRHLAQLGADPDNAQRALCAVLEAGVADGTRHAPVYAGTWAAVILVDDSARVRYSTAELQPWHHVAGALRLFGIGVPDGARPPPPAPARNG